MAKIVQGFYTGGYISGDSWATIHYVETPTQQYTRDYLALVAAAIAMGLDETEVQTFIDKTANIASHMIPTEMYKFLIKTAYEIRSKRK